MDITLNDPQRNLKPLPETGGSVLDNTLLAFFPGLSREDKQYIKNSMRWAQSRADLLYDSKRSPAQWFEHYSGVLWSVGWSLEHDPVIVIDNHYAASLVDSWSKALATQVSRSKLSLIKSTFSFLEHDRSALDLLTSSARQSGDFRFLPAEYNRNKELEILITNVRLLSSNWSSTFLFWEVQHPKSQLDIRVRRFAINQRAMSRYRERLNAAVQEMRSEEIELTMP
jgi:hypothetical protein